MDYPLPCTPTNQPPNQIRNRKEVSTKTTPKTRKIHMVHDTGKGPHGHPRDALASKKWVRMEDSGRVDDEGRPILERVDLMEAFFAGVHRQI